MSNELLDMTVRKNFDLLTIPDAYGVTAQEQAELRANCQKVVTTFRKTVFNFCVMGAQLEAIKRSGTWKYVSDDKHSTFQYRKFSDFVSYVFGFSETRTSNLMSLAKYVIEDDGEYAFINPRYQDFNESQLIEMSTLETWDRQKIQSNMTVTDIRLVKKYLKSVEYIADKLYPDFDLLPCARRWEEKEEAKKQAKEEITPGVLPGQVSVEEVASFPISEMASDGDEVQDASNEEEYKPNGGVAFAYCDLSAEDEDEPTGEESADEYDERTAAYAPDEYDERTAAYAPDEYAERTAAYAPDEYDEEDEAYEDMQGDMQTIEEDSERSIAFAELDVPPPIDVLEEEEENARVDLSNRVKIREFFSKYDQWNSLFCPYDFMKIWRFTFFNGMAVYAIQTFACENLETMKSDHSTVRYYWQNADKAVLEVTTRELERVIPLIRDEL